MRLEVDPGDGGGGDGIGCTGEWGVSAVVKNVEATDAVVEIVVGEELGEIHGLVLHCNMGLVLYWISYSTRLTKYSPAMQIAMHSSMSGDGSGGNGAGVVTFFAGSVALRSRASTSDRSLPAGISAADAADCSACLYRALEVSRKCLALPALNHTKDTRAQVTMMPTTRLDR